MFRLSPHALLLLLLAACSDAVVQRVAPLSGSFCGGNRLSIYGDGFAKKASDNRVEIGGLECKVEEVSDSKLVCMIPFRDAKVKTGKESVAELVSVHAEGRPLPMAGVIEFTFKADNTPQIVDWGPATGQASDVLSFQGKNLLFGASVELGGRECKVKHSEGTYLQCIPPPREAGVSTIEVNFGPDRGFACPGAEAAPLKFTYTLSLQSALPTEDGADAQGPMDGGGGLTAGPCSPQAPPSGTLTIVGQGLGDATVFRLCGGDTWCTREGSVTADPELYHAGDWSYQSVTCRPGPLDPSKAPGGTRKCDLTAEAADGMFVATLPDAWTYVQTTTQPMVTSTIQPGSTSFLPASYSAASPGPASATGIDLAPAPAASGDAALSAAPPAPAWAPAPAPQAAIPLATAKPPMSQKKKAKRELKKMAAGVLSDAFESLANALKSPDKAESQSLTETQEDRGLPPPHPASLPTEQPPPPTTTVPPPPPPAGLRAMDAMGAPAAAPSPGFSLVAQRSYVVTPVLRGAGRV